MIVDIQKLDAVIFPQGGSYLWGALSGPANAGKRQAVMAVLGHKLPKSKCGYMLIDESVREALGVKGTCHAETENLMIAKLKASRVASA